MNPGEGVAGAGGQDARPVVGPLCPDSLTMENKSSLMSPPAFPAPGRPVPNSVTVSCWQRLNTRQSPAFRFTE